MAIISPDTFNPLQRYVGVRLQQGVPIVDADWNELDDVRAFDLRAHRRWYVGSGVPEGTDAFALQASGAVDDFTISAGLTAGPLLGPLDTALQQAGRCLVDGREVLIDADHDFRAQPLHSSQPGATALAAAWGVPTIAELPAIDATITLYVDVWDRVVMPAEDPALIFAGLGTESCARLRREWALRWRNAASAPAPGDADHLPGHSYYAIADLDRRAADPAVRPPDLTDRRERRLLMPPAHLIEDLFGADPIAYRRGAARPAISLRRAINALLRGELPASDEVPVAPATTSRDDISYAWFLNAAGDPVGFWTSQRVGGTRQVFASSWPIDDLAAALTTPPVQVTAGAVQHRLPQGLQLPNGDYLVVYETDNSDIHYKRATQLADLSAAAEIAVVDTPDQDRHPYVVRSDDMLIFFWNRNAPDQWWYQRRRYSPTWDEADGSWLDAAPVALAGPIADNASSIVGDFHAVTDDTGAVWSVFRTAANTIAVVRLDPAAGVLEDWGGLTLGGAVVNQEPWLVIDGSAAVWVFWRSEDGVHYRRWDRAADTWAAQATVPDTGPGFVDEAPVVLRDADAALWLIWVQRGNGAPSTDNNLLVRRRNPDTGAWGASRQVVTAPGADTKPVGLAGNAGTIWLFWQSARAGSTLNNYDIYAKSLITAI